MTGAAIAIDDISLHFGATRVLDRLSLVVPTGTVFGFLGPNGAGKTSTVRILLGLVRAGSGTARVLGIDPASDGRSVRAKVGALLENDGLYDRLSAYDNLDYHARIHHIASAPARIEELLRPSGLWDRRREKVVAWSKGMRQKLAVARALLHRPALLLLDEPFTGLDPVAAADLRTTITALAKGGTTIFLTTHDLGHVEKICSSVAVLKSGAVVALGAPSALVGGTLQDEVEVRGAGLTTELLEELKRDGLVESFTFDGARARVTCSKEARTKLGVGLVQRGVIIEEIHTVRASLEEAFLALVKEPPL